jgi:hypothetical protein
LHPPDDESKSEAIAASIITPDAKRLRPLSEDWEGYKAWLRAGRPRLEQQQVTTKKQPASRKKKRALREKKEFWVEYDPALDKASKYWDVGVEGKRTRHLTKPSYAEEEAQCDSDDEPIAKIFVSPPSTHQHPFIDFKLTSPLLCRKWAKNQSQREK